MASIVLLYCRTLPKKGRVRVSGKLAQHTGVIVIVRFVDHTSVWFCLTLFCQYAISHERISFSMSSIESCLKSAALVGLAATALLGLEAALLQGERPLKLSFLYNAARKKTDIVSYAL